MSLLDTIREDMRRIVPDTDEYGVELTLVAPDTTTLVLSGLHTKHSITFDTEGNLVSGRNIHVAITEADLVENSYPYRNSNGDVDLYRHKVTAKDSTGLDKTYVIAEFFPDEKLGLIVCILSDFTA